MLTLNGGDTHLLVGNEVVLPDIDNHFLHLYLYVPIHNNVMLYMLYLRLFAQFHISKNHTIKVTNYKL